MYGETSSSVWIWCSKDVFFFKRVKLKPRIVIKFRMLQGKHLKNYMGSWLQCFNHGLRRFDRRKTTKRWVFDFFILQSNSVWTKRWHSLSFFILKSNIVWTKWWQSFLFNIEKQQCVENKVTQSFLFDTEKQQCVDKMVRALTFFILKSNSVWTKTWQSLHFYIIRERCVERH